MSKYVEMACDLIIRPPRFTYKISDLQDLIEIPGYGVIKRKSISFKNKRNLNIVGSFYAPNEKINEIQDIYKTIDPSLYSDDPLRICELNNRLNNSQKSENLAPIVSQLIGLCFFYEDLYHSNPNAVNTELIQSATNQLQSKVSHFSTYTKQLEIQKTEIDTPQKFSEAVSELRHKLEEMESVLGIV